MRAAEAADPAPQYPFSASPVVPATPTRPGWTWHRLTDLARLATGHTPSRRCPEYWTGDIPWLQLPDIRALDGKYASDTSEHTNALGIDNSAAVLLPAGTVCLSRTASVGFVTIMGRPMATSQDFVNWVCGPDLAPEFLMHLFIACREPIRGLGSGAVHHTIYFPTVQAFSISIPPVAEQQRIAAGLGAALSAVGDARRAARERVAAADALPAAYLREVFDGPAAADWPAVPLGDLCDGPGQYGTSQRSNRDGRGLPVLGMPHIHEGRIRWERVSHVDLEPAEMEKYRLRPGDILFNRTNSAELVGKSAVFDGQREAVFASYLVRFRLRPVSADPDFVTAYINSYHGRAYVERHMARAVGQVNISASTMQRMPVPCPPLAEQRRVAAGLAERLAGAEAVAAACRAERAAVDALPAAYLRAAFPAGG